MASFKFFVFVALLINLSLVIADSCDSFNCKRCVELMSQQNPEEKLQILTDYCIENADQMALNLNQLFAAGNDVKIYLYNLTDKVNEMYGENPEKEDVFHKSIVVYGKEFNLLPSIGMITQSDPDDSLLGKPVEITYLGTTKKTENQFMDYLHSLNLDEFKDENFDKHLNDILSFLLSE